MSERRIGKVISVDSFRVVIQLDSDIKSLYKSGFNDIYEIARINSYVIIPVGADRIVAIITRVKIQDETELEKSSGSITLPKAERYLVATMLGTIENSGGKTEYKQGVYNYPILDNPVWYVVKEDLDKIFDLNNNVTIDYAKDYYLPIGSSPAFADYEIKINPDKLFSKHSAVLGNTGSGKSCTVAAIIQSLFRFQYPDSKKLKSSNIIIFDTNGEYQKAFIGDDESKKLIPPEINAFYISSEGLKVPYWFMNYDDFDFLFQPSALTQAPVFKRAIGLAKEGVITDDSKFIPKPFERYISKLIESEDLFMKKNHKQGKDWAFNPNNEIIKLSNEITDKFPEIKKLLKKIGEEKESVETLKLQQTLNKEFTEYLSSKEESKIETSSSIDLPVHFNYKELITQFIDIAIEESEGSSQKLRENISTLKLRLHSFLTDDRISLPLLLKDIELNESDKEDFLLSKFLMFILGNFFNVPKDKLKCIFSDYFNTSETKKTKGNQITIIDLSLLPFEVLETITGLLGRLILEFASRINQADKTKQRGDLPIVLVLEEAQNYIPEKDKGDRTSISKKVFERVAREGRKFGVSLLISSQRPSELSKTALSQCNSFIIHRLQNPDDQKYIRQLVSSANEDILQQLPILPQQQAIVMGDAVRTPVQVKINDVNPKPDSENPKFIEKWLAESSFKHEDFLKLTKAWVEGKKET